MIVRRSVRFWDPTATPLPLVAPDNGAHVRYGFGDFRPARPEWTRSNPAFVNCLTLHLTQTPLAIAPVSDWSGPEAILVHATAGGARGGSLQLWSVTRSAVSVPACRFDEPLPPADYAAREQALLLWPSLLLCRRCCCGWRRALGEFPRRFDPNRPTRPRGATRSAASPIGTRRYRRRKSPSGGYRPRHVARRTGRSAGRRCCVRPWRRRSMRRG